VNSQRLFCNQKAGVKCSYQSFLVYKYILNNNNLKQKLLEVNFDANFGIAFNILN